MDTIIYGVYKHFWPTLRLLDHVQLGDYHAYNHIWCVQTFLTNLTNTRLSYSMCSWEATMHTVINGLGWPEPYIYGVHTVFWAGKSPIYGHVRCIYTVLANPIYGVYKHFWLTL
jgi:hypothetical protein